MHRYWNDGWTGGWWWMAIMMIIVWCGVIWIAVTAIRVTSHTPHVHAPRDASTPPTTPTPREILAERLARGEIEPDDYRRRLDVLDQRTDAAQGPISRAR